MAPLLGLMVLSMNPSEKELRELTCFEKDKMLWLKIKEKQTKTN